MRLAALLLLVSSYSAAQQFEIVSIRPISGNAEFNVDSTRGRLTATSITVRELLRLA